MPETSVPREGVGTLVVGGISAALFLSFFRYGLNLEDEGTILYQILRTHRGELPYLDFHTGYTPAMFYLNAGLFDLFGVSVLPLRLFLVAVNTAAVVLIFRLSLRVAPALESGLAALAYTLSLPFFAGQFASFNIPYPAWYAVTAWLLTEFASVRAAETGRRSWLAAAGALAGVAFSFKPNTGVLALGAVVLARLLTAPPLAGRVGGVLEGTVLGVACVGVLAVLTFDLWTEQFLLLGVPILVWIVGCARQRRRASHRRPLADGFRDVGAIVGAFVVVVGSWLAFFLPRLGLARFGREVLLLGAGVERIYLLYYPDVSAWTVVLLGLGGAAGALPWALDRGLVRGRTLLVAGVATMACGVLALAAFGLAPEGVALSVGMQLENASFFVVPALLLAAVLVGLTRLAKTPADEPKTAVWSVLVVYGLLLFLQLYPRIDFMHVVISMPSALVLGAAGLAWVQRRWWRAVGDPAVPEIPHGRVWLFIRLAVLLPVALAFGARVVPFVDARFALEAAGEPRVMTRLPFAALPIEIERDRDHDFRELAAAARFARTATDPEQPILAFPALGVIPFITGRSTPVPHDYFFAGRPDHADEAAMIEQIEEERPPLLVTLNDRLGYFSAAPAYYFLLRDYFATHYRRVRRFGRYDVLARRDWEPRDPDWARLRETTGPGETSLALARGRFRDEVRRARRVAHDGEARDLEGRAPHLAAVDRRLRGVWTRALLAVAEREPGGLEAVERAMATDRRSRLLFVRALGEYAGPEAVPYLERVYLGPDERLGWEAARSINFILARRLAARFRFGEAESGPLWGLPEGRDVEPLVGLIGDFAERQRIGPMAALAVAREGRLDLADRLEWFESERETTWWRMLAALSLVELGRTQHMRTLIDSLNSGTLAGQYVPSLLLDPEVLNRNQVEEAMRETLRVGSAEERETVAWMIPFLAEPVRRELWTTALADPEASVRHAAEWGAERDRAVTTPVARGDS